MQTVLHVSPMDVGHEVAVREAHHRFPIESLSPENGVERLVVFIGSGLYALEITVSDGDFQANFHRFLGTPAVRELFAAITPHVRALPAADAKTADLPLATAMLLWQNPGSADSTTV
jgi:hypothetical protein